MKRKTVSFLALLVFARVGFATKDRHPPVTEETLIGVWEAISERDTRVYRMEINREGDSFLAYAVPHGWSWVCKLVKKEVKDGEVFLEFKSLKKKSRVIRIKGEGVAGRDGARDEGVIVAELVMNPDQEPPNVWKLRFIKAPHIEELYGLSKSAEKAIEKAKAAK